MRRREFIAAGETTQGKKMNPIEWKREHQIAPGAAIPVGFELGPHLWIHARPPFRRFLGLLHYSTNYPTNTGTGWGIFGAIVGAAVIYMAQLMRR
jgi:hypothetical protein